MAEGPPEVLARNNRLMVYKDGKMSRGVIVTLSDKTSFLATHVFDSIRNLEEQGLPFPHFFTDFIEFFNEHTNEFILVNGKTIVKIT